MDALTLQHLTGNAFRTLGLRADASQEQIDSAARLMRLYAGQAEQASAVPPTENDAAWLGAVGRSGKEIEQAVMRLADPAMRVEERLWWFCEAVPANGAVPPHKEGETPARRHDAALLRLLRVVESGPSPGFMPGAAGRFLDQWGTLIGQFEELAEAQDYREWMLRAEEGGDFEKRASAGEIAEAQGRMPRRISTGLLPAADHALLGRNFAALGKIIRMLQVGGGVEAGRNDPALRMINRMEDVLVGSCNELKERIDLAWKTQRIETLKPACERVVKAFRSHVVPLLEAMIHNVPEDQDRRQRAIGTACGVLEHAADGYLACFDRGAALTTLKRALVLARRSIIEDRIHAKIQRVKAGPKPAGRWFSGSRGNGGGAARRVGGVFVVVIVIAIGRVVMMGGMSGSSRNIDFSNDKRYLPDPQSGSMRKQAQGIDDIYRNNPQLRDALKSAQLHDALNDPVLRDALKNVPPGGTTPRINSNPFVPPATPNTGITMPPRGLSIDPNDFSRPQSIVPLKPAPNGPNPFASQPSNPLLNAGRPSPFSPAPVGSPGSGRGR